MELEELGGSLLGVAGATVAPTEQYQASKKNRAKIRDGEMYRLEKGKWLNDEQINFVFQW